MKKLFWVCVLGIVYFSLYPWTFHPLGAPVTRPLEVWQPFVARSQYLDVVANFFFYMPLGMFGVLAWCGLKPGWRRWAAVGAAGAALSLTLETAQAWIPSRDSSALDVVVNTLSTIAGIWIGAAIGRLRPDGVGGKALTLSRPMPLALAAAWLVAQCFPFLPVMRVRLLRDSVAQMLRVSDLSWLNLVGAFVGCLLLSYILRVLLEKSTWRVALIVAFLVFPLRVFLQGAAVSWPYLVAAALAFGFASRAFSRPSAAGAGLLAWLALLLITVNEFYPLALADAPAPFLWTPFAGFLEANRDAAIRVVLAKFFLYGSAVWALREGGLPLWMSTGLVTVLLAVSEAAQCYLPGRVPESTDPLLALAAGVLMVWLKDRPRTRRIG